MCVTGWTVSHKIHMWSPHPKTSECDCLEVSPWERWLSSTEAVWVGPDPKRLHRKEGHLLTQRDRADVHTQRTQWGTARGRASACQGQRPQEKPTLPALWLWTSSLQNWDKNCFLLWKPPTCSTLSPRSQQTMQGGTPGTIVTWAEWQSQVGGCVAGVLKLSVQPRSSTHPWKKLLS